MFFNSIKKINRLRKEIFELLLRCSQNFDFLGSKNLSPGSLSNSGRHSAILDVIANVKSKIIVSRWHFFAEMIFSAT